MKNIEIERKFLVNNDSYKQLANNHFTITQGYISKDPDRTVRVRIKTSPDGAGKAFLTIKSKPNELGFSRFEWEKEIDVRNFIQLNYTPYEGADEFLTEPTETTKKLWDKVLDLYKKEQANNGVLDIDTKTISSIAAHEAGYIDKELEKVSLNMTSNLIGVGDAATVYAVAAMGEMQKNNIDKKSFL